MNERKRFQFCWFLPDWWMWPWIAFRREQNGSWRFIYRWYLWLGPLEVRRWSTLRPTESEEPKDGE